jgi:hypothetical protein
MSDEKNNRIYSVLRTNDARSVVMNRRLVFAAFGASGLACSAALAHHGWGSYDASKVMIVDAVVTDLRWQNPHVHIDVNHDNASWELVLAPPFRMEVRGLSPEMIKAGTRVRVEGYPSTRVAHEMRAERIRVGSRTFELR